MTKLDIDAYRKSYGQKLVLDIPTLSLDNGIYWVKGANGAGKSTLFKSIAGMIPFSGSIQNSNNPVYGILPFNITKSCRPRDHFLKLAPVTGRSRSNRILAPKYTLLLLLDGNFSD